jgi:hypothetical protein
MAIHRNWQSSWTNRMLPWQAQGWRSGRSAAAGKRQMRHCSSSSSSSSYAGPAASGSAVSGGAAAAAAITAFLPSLFFFFGFFGMEPSFSKLLSSPSPSRSSFWVSQQLLGFAWTQGFK